jgi:hypothetical protein
MGDWSSLGVFSPPKQIITTKEAYDDCGGLMTNSPMNVATVWQSASRAVYVPFYVMQTPVTVYQMGFEVTTQSGNYDIGIYDTAGNRLVSKGSTAVPVTDIADTLLRPGVYYAALDIDNAVAAIRAASGSTVLAAAAGVKQQAVGVVTLPATATFAVATSSMWPYIVMFTTTQPI